MINLITKYAGKIQTAFKKESLLTGRLSTEYEFTGAKTVKVIIPQTVPMGNYTRNGANRYGVPTEMQDSAQEMTLTQDKAFSMTIDKGNNAEQGGLKNAGTMLKLQIKERAVPLSDSYGFEQLVNKAGVIVGNGTALSKTTICDRISLGVQSLDDSEVAEGGRTLYLSNACYGFLKHSPEFLGIDSLGEKALAKGQVGEYDNMAVVKIPKSRWPANVNFLIVQKNCATFPVTLNESKYHKDPPGISGDLLEGRQIYDLFVFAAKCGGVYAEVDTGSGKGTIVATPTISNAGVIATATADGVCVYTTDGSDPRYSDSKKVGTQSDVLAVGTVIKAYAYKPKCFPSSVVEVTVTA